MTTVRALFRHELRVLLRDRRTVVLSVVLPILIFPLMIFATRTMQQRRMRGLEATVYKYAVTGSEAESVRTLIARGREAAPREPKREDGSAPLARFVCDEVRVPDPAGALSRREIHFYLEGIGGKEADALLEREKREKPRAPGLGPGRGSRRMETVQRQERLAGVPLVRIHFQGDRDSSSAGRSRMDQLLRLARLQDQAALLSSRGFPIPPAKVAAVDDANLASKRELAGAFIGKFLTLFLVMFMLTGGAVASMDIVAGEKERGSLETLLTTAVRRIEIVSAKLLAIVAVALVITFIQIANILVYLTLKLIPLPPDMVIEVPPGTVLTLLVLFVPVAVALSAVLLMLSAYAKSYKEAQLYFLPVYLCALVPAAASTLPGISLRSAISVVPLANVSVAVREVMVGKFDWPMIGVTMLVMAASAGWMVRVSARMLSRERLVTASEADAADLSGGPELFPKHVLRWYAVLGAILFVVAANIPQLATFRRQLLFNEIAIFLAAPALMIWKYRLPVRAALALRPVRPIVWFATLVIIPSAHLVGIAAFLLADKVVPVPRRMLEQFGRELLPDMPLWQLLFFVSVLPGICEEIGFRGTLLYGLRRRFHPVMLAVVVGVIFGFFHVSLFRIAPTGLLGIFLTGIALLTGSIFPGMLAHAGNNALGVLAAKNGFALAELEGWVYGSAALVFALAFWILYRNRTPYPDLRARPPQR